MLNPSLAQLARVLHLYLWRDQRAYLSIHDHPLNAEPAHTSDVHSKCKQRTDGQEAHPSKARGPERSAESHHVSERRHAAASAESGGRPQFSAARRG
jgi:hypothetical protein